MAPTAPPRDILATGAVRFVGEAVAAIIAETLAAARDAAEAIEVDYEELPAAIGPGRAAAAGAPLVWEGAPGNIVAESHYGEPGAAAEAAFAKAAHVVSLEIENQRLAPVSMEPRVAIGDYDAGTGRITLRLSSQMPSGVRDAICKELPTSRPTSCAFWSVMWAAASA